jgi:iron-sulfur cluster repair protein YtfE (RIC family)
VSPSPDPIADFEHDHASLTELVFDLRRAIEAVRRDPSRAGEGHGRVSARLEALRESLFLHFAREEEGLFPFVMEHLPDTRAAVQALESAHDTVCGSLSRMTYHVRRGREKFAEELTAMWALFERFESAYGEHSRQEAALLRTVSGRLGEADRVQLAEMVRGL